MHHVNAKSELNLSNRRGSLPARVCIVKSCDKSHNAIVTAGIFTKHRQAFDQANHVCQSVIDNGIIFGECDSLRHSQALVDFPFSASISRFNCRKGPATGR
jgi:hypothetical protein